MDTVFYKILNKDGEVVYVGVTTRTIGKRFGEHIRSKRLNPKLYSIVELDRVHHPEISSLEIFYEERRKVAYLERKYIREAQESDANLLNLSEGGEWGASIVHRLQKENFLKVYGSYDGFRRYIRRRQILPVWINHWICGRTSNPVKVWCRSWVHHRTSNPAKVWCRVWAHHRTRNPAKAWCNNWIHLRTSNPAKAWCGHWVYCGTSNPVKAWCRSWAHHKASNPVKVWCQHWICGRTSNSTKVWIKNWVYNRTANPVKVWCRSWIHNRTLNQTKVWCYNWAVYKTLK